MSGRTHKLKHSRRSSRPESDHSWAGAPSQRRRIKSTSPPIPGPNFLRQPPGSRATRRTEVQKSRRHPSRRTPTLSRPAPAGSRGLRPILARRRPRRKEATSRPAPADTNGLRPLRARRCPRGKVTTNRSDLSGPAHTCVIAGLRAGVLPEASRRGIGGLDVVSHRNISPGPLIPPGRYG
jgi:hypothetical protein